MTKPTQKRGADRRRFHYIYKTTCLITGRYYIGMHSTDDMDDGYMGSGKRLGYSLRKYGVEHHVKEILEHLLTRDALILREEQIVTPELIADPMCMNLVRGGKGDWGWRKTLSDDDLYQLRIRKLSEAWSKPGYKESFSAKTTGRKRSEEVKEKMRAKWTPERRVKQAVAQAERVKKRFEGYWLTHKTRAERRAVARALKPPVDRSQLSKDGWANMDDERRLAAKQAMSQAKLGRVTVNNGVQTKIVHQAEAESLLANGWALGKPLAPGRIRANGRTRSAR